MGYKTRIIKIEEEYFDLEIDDIARARHSFTISSRTRPSVCIIHPDNAMQLRRNLAGQCPNWTDNDNLQAYGLDIIESYNQKKDTIRIV